MLKAVRDLELPISEMEVARAAGFDRRSMATNADVITALLKDSESSQARRKFQPSFGDLDSQA
jgi:hypothetical protein